MNHSALPNRRKFIGQALALSGAAILPGCATTGTVQNPPTMCLPRVKASSDRVIRRLVGLRPYRPAGFVVRREQLGNQQIIHNYGHGGGGITLSWGSSRLAVDLLPPDHRGPVAVIGSGVMGLTTARLLQEAGQSVTIYTSKLPPFTTSNIAGGQFFPSGVFSRRQMTAAFQRQFVAAVRYSYERFQLLVGDRYGVRWRPNYEISADPIGMGMVDQLMTGMTPERRQLSAAENPFGTAHARVWQTMFIEPAKLLRQLLQDILIAGGDIKLRHFDRLEDITGLDQRVVFNCTGLGAAKLFADDQLIPIRGQLELLLPQPEINHAYVTRQGMYMFPRSDGVVLGGTYQRGVTDLNPDPDISRRIISGHQAVADSMTCA